MTLSPIPRFIAALGSTALVLLATAFTHADDPNPETEPPSSPPPLVLPSDIKKEGDLVKLPGLTIHATAKPYVVATGKMALTEGLLEFVAVEKEGRTYESLVSLDCKPSAMQFALLLIGCEPSPNPSKFIPDGKMGDRLDIDLEWEQDGKTTRLPIEQLLVNRKTSQPPNDLIWYFTGSNFIKTHDGKQRFYADIDQSFIALLWMPGVLINLGNDFGNPYEGADQGFDVNTKHVPPEGTPVRMIFRKH